MGGTRDISLVIGQGMLMETVLRITMAQFTWRGEKYDEAQQTFIRLWENFHKTYFVCQTSRVYCDPEETRI